MKRITRSGPGGHMATNKIAMYYHVQMFLCGGEDHWPVKMFHPRSDAYRPRPSRIPQPSPLYKIQNGGDIHPSMGQRSIKRLEDKLKAWRRSLCVK